MTRNASVLLVVLLGATAAVTSSDAHACGGFYDYPEVRPVWRPKPVFVAASERIPRAVEWLEEEKLVEAATEVVTAFPKVRGIPVGASPLETRAQRVLALALVRAEGTLAGVRGFTARTAADRTANLGWATGVLRSISAERRAEPAAQADLAEALEATPGKEDEALGILADLADRDLLGSAHAYAALARIRALRGDADSARGALARCERMTRTPSVVCKAPEGLVAAAPFGRAPERRLAVQD
jgi:hypothetical protein